jgi:hypothetical protein
MWKQALPGVYVPLTEQTSTSLRKEFEDHGLKRESLVLWRNSVSLLQN